MKVKHSIIGLMLLLGILDTGCKSLKHVYEFSASSEKIIDRYEHIPYSYYRYCRDACDLDRQTGIITGKIQFRPKDTLSCNCDSELIKDKDATKAYVALILYFSSLQQLADGEKFNYKTGNLVSALGKIKAIKDPKMVGPVNSIADILLNMATRAYRSHSLQKILEQSKEPVDNLLNDLILNNQILEDKYKVYYSGYLNVMMQKYAGPHVEPRQQLDDYLSNNHEIEKEKRVLQEIEDFNALLTKVKEGHLKLAAERINLKNKDLIIYLYSQSKELKANLSKL